MVIGIVLPYDHLWEKHLWEKPFRNNLNIVYRMTSRAYVITINNWTEGDYAALAAESNDYMIIGKEVGENGTPHLQAYIYKKNKISFVGLKKRNPRAHIDVAKGNAEENKNYCSKEKDFTEFGEIPAQGKRTDLDTIAKEITEGTQTAESILLTQPTMYHQYGRTLEKLEDLRMRKQWRKEMTKCKWYYGATGTGKSYTAFKDYTPETHYVFTTTDKGWWDGYRQQEIVIINEFRGQLPYSELLDLIDENAKFVPRRGREPMPFTSKMIIITSSLHPAEIYHNLSQSDKMEQLYERIELIELTGESKRKKCV